jgi:hypothetical protein
VARHGGQVKQMPDWLPDVAFTDLSAVGLLALVFLFVLWGKLIPVRTHERELGREAEKAEVWARSPTNDATP